MFSFFLMEYTRSGKQYHWVYVGGKQVPKEGKMEMENSKHWNVNDS